MSKKLQIKDYRGLWHDIDEWDRMEDGTFVCQTKVGEFWVDHQNVDMVRVVCKE